MIEEIEIKKNQIVKLLNILPKEYELSFEVKPTSYDYTTWKNIIHLTVEGNDITYGDRTPGVWVHSDHNVYFASALNGDPNSNFEANFVMRLMEWTKIKISQLLIEGNYNFTIQVEETIIYNVINNDTREFRDVKVYVGDPWFDAQPGYVRNLIIKNAFVGKNLY